MHILKLIRIVSTDMINIIMKLLNSNIKNCNTESDNNNDNYKHQTRLIITM